MHKDIEDLVSSEGENTQLKLKYGNNFHASAYF